MPHRVSPGNALFAGNATTFTTVNGGVGTGADGDHRRHRHLQWLGDYGGLTQSGGELNGTGTLTVTGTGPVPALELLGRDAERFWDDDCTEWCTRSVRRASGWMVVGRCNWAAPARRVEQVVQINLNNGNPNTGVSDPGSGTLTILSGATFTDQTTGASGLTIIATNHGGSDTGATAVVNNAGTFTKSGSATTSTISTLFNNTGTVNVTSGTLNLSGGGTDVGAVYAGAGTIEFGGGTRTLDATSSIPGNALFAGNATTFTTVNGGVGTGLMAITAGTATFNGSVTTGGPDAVRRRAQRHWHVDGDGHGLPFRLSNFSGGTQSGSGTTIAQNGATFSSTGFGLDGGRTLQLGGASTTSGASVQINLNNSNPNTSVSDLGSGTLTILSGATFTDQTTGGLTIFATNRGGSDTGVDGGGEQRRHVHQERQRDLDHQHAVQQHRDRERHIGQHAEPERRWYGCRGGLRRCRHHRVRRRHADAGCHIEHYRAMRCLPATRRRSRRSMVALAPA